MRPSVVGRTSLVCMRTLRIRNFYYRFSVVVRRGYTRFEKVLTALLEVSPPTLVTGSKDNLIGVISEEWKRFKNFIFLVFLYISVFAAAGNENGT